MVISLEVSIIEGPRMHLAREGVEFEHAFITIIRYLVCAFIVWPELALLQSLLRTKSPVLKLHKHTSFAL